MNALLWELDTCCWPLAPAGRRWRRWSACAVLAMTWACTASDTPDAAIGGLERTIPPLPTSFHRGMNIEPIGGYGAPIDLRALPVSLDALVELGVDHVALIPSFFQPRLGVVELTWRPSRDRVESDTRLAIRLAHERGLAVLLKPHLWLDDRSDGAWRGDIDPDRAAWPAWERAYRDAVLGFARLGAQEQVAGISMGSELTRVALAHPDFWRQLASDIREVFSGELTYAANWDREFEQIEWWDAVDHIGVDAFWPLTGVRDEALDGDKCLERLDRIRNLMATVAARYDRPILLTEVGYKSALGAAYRPWEWHDDQVADVTVQSTAYACLAESLGAVAGDVGLRGPTTEKASWLVGVYFWIWHTDLEWGGLDNSDFTPRGKPAQQILRTWFQAR